MKHCVGRRAWLLASGLCLLATAPKGWAANDYSTEFMPIGRLTAYSFGETIYPAWAQTVEVIFSSPITWKNSTTCSANAVVIYPTDAPLVIAVHQALATGRPVRVFVDDSKQLNGVCYLRAVEI